MDESFMDEIEFSEGEQAAEYLAIAAAWSESADHWRETASDDGDLINRLKHMADDYECCRETVYCAIHEIENLARLNDCRQFDLDSWETWAREVCEDFKIEYDNHPIGLRAAIVKWMANAKAERAQLRI